MAADDDGTGAFRGASFTGADFTGADFRDCDLRQVKVTDSWLVNVRMSGLIPYTVNGEMRFYFSIDEKCMSHKQVDTLQREFTAVLQNQALQAHGGEGREH